MRYKNTVSSKNLEYLSEIWCHYPGKLFQILSNLLNMTLFPVKWIKTFSLISGNIVKSANQIRPCQMKKLFASFVCSMNQSLWTDYVWAVRSSTSRCSTVSKYMNKYVTIFLFVSLTDVYFIATLSFVWKVTAITLVSCLPLYILKYLRRRFSPPSYSKLTSWTLYCLTRLSPACSLTANLAPTKLKVLERQVWFTASFTLIVK